MSLPLRAFIIQARCTHATLLLTGVGVDTGTVTLELAVFLDNYLDSKSSKADQHNSQYY